MHPKSKKASKKAGSAKQNRRILLAQAINIRNYVDKLLDKDLDRQIIVCGDMNDGIGLDPFEYVLGGDFAGIVTGTVRKPHQLFVNACENQILENIENPGKHFSISFKDKNKKIQKKLVDHILLSLTFKTSPVSLKPDSGCIRKDILKKFPKSSDHVPIEAIISF